MENNTGCDSKHAIGPVILTVTPLAATVTRVNTIILLSVATKQRPEAHRTHFSIKQSEENKTKLKKTVFTQKKNFSPLIKLLFHFSHFNSKCSELSLQTHYPITTNATLQGRTNNKWLTGPSLLKNRNKSEVKSAPSVNVLKSRVKTGYLFL